MELARVLEHTKQMNMGGFYTTHKGWDFLSYLLTSLMNLLGTWEPADEELF
nr:hypothetical protein Q903MT_gene3097 [Picea sitchensis]